MQQLSSCSKKELYFMYQLWSCVRCHPNLISLKKLLLIIVEDRFSRPLFIVLKTFQGCLIEKFSLNVLLNKKTKDFTSETSLRDNSRRISTQWTTVVKTYAQLSYYGYQMFVNFQTWTVASKHRYFRF